MKVLWLAPHPLPTAGKRMHPAPWITSLAELLADRGIDITILTTGKRLDADVKEFDMKFYKLVIVNSPSGLLDSLTFFTRRIAVFKEYISKVIDEFDLVHVHGTEHQYATSLSLIKNRKIPYVISIQGLLYRYKDYINDVFTKRRLLWEIGAVYEKKEIRKGDNFMCRTHWDTSSVLSLNSSASIFQIWEMLRKEFYEKIQATGEQILFSGGSNSLKGLDTALRVFSSVLKEKKLVLNVIGGACGWDYIEKVKKKYQLTNLTKDHVILHGGVSSEKIIELYRNCFCLYHPSLIDNSPNSVCEAQLAGLPVIARNTGGVSSLIDHKVTGILVNDAIQEHVKELLDLYDNKALQHTLADNARRLALRRHDRDLIVEDVISAYQKLIN